MNRSVRMKGVVVAGLLGVALGASAALAGEVVRDGFDGLAQPGLEGGGLTVEQIGPAVGSPEYVEHAIPRSGRRGVMSFDLQRKVDAPAGRRTVFEFLGKDQETLLFVQVDWAAAANQGRPWLEFRGGPYWYQGLGLWGPVVPFDSDVAPGRWIHVDLAWDDGPRTYQVFVDGRPQRAPLPFYDAPRGLLAEDPRPTENGLRQGAGEPPRYTATPFGSFLAEARQVRLGIHLEAGSATTGTTPLSNAVLDNFVITVDEPWAELHGPGHDVKDLKGVFTPAGVELTWAPPEIHGIDQQYTVYRRAGDEGKGRFEKLSAQPVRALRYVDATASAGETYRYSVTSVYGDGGGGALEGKYPPEVTVTAAALAVGSVAAEKALYGGGQEIVITLRGTADKAASFTLEGVAADAPMAEVDDGVYVGKVAVPAGVSLAKAALTGRLTDPAAGAAATKAGAAVALDATAPEAVGGIVISVPWAGEIEVSWQASRSADVDHYQVLRAAGAASPAGAAPSPSPSLSVYQSTRELAFTDRAVIPGLSYRYAVVAVDKAGNASAASDTVNAQAVAGDGPRITGVSLAPFGKPLRPGESVAVTLTGASGGKASVDLGTLAPGLALTEQGKSGTYAGSYTVKAEDVGATLAKAPTVAHLTDDFGASVQAGPELTVVGQDTLDDHTPPALTSVTHDGFQVAGFSGALAAGDVVTVTVQGEAGGSAWFDLGGVVKDRPLAETAPGSGTYRGSYTVRFGDAGTGATVTGHLADAAGNETLLPAERPLAFDTRVRLSVEAAEKLLPADRTAKTRLTAKATDANGRAVTGHELVLTLSTTEEYTGVVGGGTLAGQQATMDDVDDVEVKWGGVSDGFGAVTADYTAGFAAKTALVLAKDLTTGDVGAGWLNTYVASTVAIELAPRTQKGAEDQAVLRMAADPTKLTADGRSTSRIKVWLSDRAGSALAGAKISFALGNANGRVKVLKATTDGKGIAEAQYRAGTAIGTVTVTASAVDYGVTGSVQITLMSDAPAKIELVASSQRLVANGSDTATLAVVVTDIHDNPNQEVPVTFALLKGSGNLSTSQFLTDRNGEGTVRFTAGTQPGTAIVEARHTSRAPTEGELRRVYGTLFVPRWFERQERDRLTVSEWLVKPGEAVTKGQTLAVVATRRSEWTVAAPAKGVFVREVKHEGDAAELGETIGYVEIDPDVWKAQYGN